MAYNKKPFFQFESDAFSSFLCAAGLAGAGVLSWFKKLRLKSLAVGASLVGFVLV